MDGLSIFAKFAILVSAVLTAGGAMATVSCMLPARRGLQRTGAVIGVLSSGVYFASQAAVLTGRWDGVFIPGIARLLWQGGAGPIILFLALTYVLFLPVAENRTVLLLKSVVLLVALAMLSHLDTFLKPVLFLHLLMALVWAGVILPFLGRMKQSELAEQAHRFGQIAVGILPLLFIAGVALVWFRTEGDLLRLWSSWGLLLSLKLVFFMIAALIGLRNKLKIVPYITEMRGSAATQFRRAMKLDVFIFIVILGLSAVLAYSVPG